MHGLFLDVRPESALLQVLFFLNDFCALGDEYAILALLVAPSQEPLVHCESTFGACGLAVLAGILEALGSVGVKRTFIDHQVLLCCVLILEIAYIIQDRPFARCWSNETRGSRSLAMEAFIDNWPKSVLLVLLRPLYHGKPVYFLISLFLLVHHQFNPLELLLFLRFDDVCSAHVAQIPLIIFKVEPIFFSFPRVYFLLSLLPLLKVISIISLEKVVDLGILVWILLLREIRISLMILRKFKVLQFIYSSLPDVRSNCHIGH